MKNKIAILLSLLCSVVTPHVVAMHNGPVHQIVRVFYANLDEEYRFTDGRLENYEMDTTEGLGCNENLINFNNSYENFKNNKNNNINDFFAQLNAFFSKTEKIGINKKRGILTAGEQSPEGFTVYEDTAEDRIRQEYAEMRRRELLQREWKKQKQKEKENRPAVPFFDFTFF